MNIQPPLYEHQQKSIEFLSNHDYAFDMSDPGTGKTRSMIETIRSLQERGFGRALVFCPKSIMKPAWGNDIKRYAPDMSWCIAEAKNREAMLKNTMADIVITNHDAVRYIQPSWLTTFDILIIDESTAYKNPTSARTKAMMKIRGQFQRVYLMSGTAIPNTVLDVWSQMFILDKGERLGNKFYGFRMAVCSPEQVGRDARMKRWVDKPGSVDAVSLRISDVTVRHVFEECLDIPEHAIHTVECDVPDSVMLEYKAFIRSSLMILDQGAIDPVHAADFMNKLLQVTAGTVYDQSGEPHCLFDDRYELIMDLIEERKHCVVAFLWRHQRDKLCELADKRGFTFATIDGSTSLDQRTAAVEDFQAGKLKAIFAHPASAAHGLTLTRGTTTIWTSPTYNLEHYLQFNRRIYRAGQTKKTETIHICALDTIETEVYNRLLGKKETLDDLLTSVKLHQ
jgi:SNF2 family DNA or RNA helicase